MLAWTLATLIYRLTSPLSTVYFPRLAQYSATGDHAALYRTYKEGCRSMGIIVAPVCTWMAVFSEPILAVWTQDPDLAKAASLPLTLLSIGTMCHCFMHLPYSLQLSLNHTRLALWQNAVAVATLAPLTYVLATRYGLAGAATPWLILNLSYLAFTTPLMHRMLRVPGLTSWYVDAVLWPLALSVAFVGSAHWLYVHVSTINQLSLAIPAAGLALAVVSIFFKQKHASAHPL